MSIMQTDVLTILLVVIMAGLLIYLVTASFDYIKRRRRGIEQEKTNYKLITIATCQQNDYTIEREFKEGDFVGKIDGKCPKCGSALIISKIYAVAQEKTQKSFKP
ncbi:hypothetical protein QPL79_02985 [Ignisphaera sp. 4213-co]|uniref:DUF5679 domain-containing protein n=1 Tax=Ignisphaera cupida TaxID=3050454 RepID=A0ABD4Z4T7_9CREN|nr:hypothetical protein [Ignisphaera sp. 4213-co]MDK6028327.1 hypothetical protein [Ignisphaera sp. 4213-co]